MGWKQWWTYRRSPDYNLVRFFFTFVAALVLGTIFWQMIVEIRDIFVQSSNYILFSDSLCNENFKVVDMVQLLLPHGMDNLWNTKGSGNFPGPKHKRVCQNHLGYDLNFKAPTDVILVASAAFSSPMFAVCIKILNFQQR
ncbi:hypothetical protein Dsin_013916 [Dipteronia sinensis]|uniref:ABC-2 type transporter transmembrane domain-containing protein n=1 Tax=Dipteronia sinensis TaxID=43782 RepID=A0AAE0AKY4_9ROSI|nr:hypothetical protein Dsin_013916 [Dipteronia sinensis]